MVLAAYDTGGQTASLDVTDTASVEALVAAALTRHGRVDILVNNAGITRDQLMLRLKREELVQKRDELVSRAKMATAQRQVQDAVRDVSVMDPTSELNRFEERVRREEAMARGMQEVAASSLEEEFAALDDADTEAEVNARLAGLRSGA